jgi:hypothetical protein
VSFRALATAILNVTNPKVSLSNFAKKIEEIHVGIFPQMTTRIKALALAKHGLIRQFTGLWPSLESMDFWIENT